VLSCHARPPAQQFADTVLGVRSEQRHLNPPEGNTETAGMTIPMVRRKEQTDAAGFGDSPTAYAPGSGESRTQVTPRQPDHTRVADRHRSARSQRGQQLDTAP